MHNKSDFSPLWSISYFYNSSLIEFIYYFFVKPVSRQFGRGWNWDLLLKKDNQKMRQIYFKYNLYFQMQIVQIVDDNYRYRYEIAKIKRSIKAIKLKMINHWKVKARNAKTIIVIQDISLDYLKKRWKSNQLKTNLFQLSLHVIWRT